MSRFFRYGSNSSSSDSGPSTDNGGQPEEVREDLSQEVLASNKSYNSNAVDRPSVNGKNDHRDLLLHALLEERCINDVLASYDKAQPNRRQSRDTPEVQAQAKARYQTLCAQLAPLNLISTGLEADHHAVTRQKYREGLDYLTQQRSTVAVPPAFRRLLADTEASTGQRHEPEIATLGATRYEQFFKHRNGLHLSQKLLSGIENKYQYSHGGDFMQLAPAFRYALSMHTRARNGSVIESRYHSEFEELGTVGKGGYGIVYRVKHRLDNQAYAVKKVPLSATRLQRIQNRGEPEFDEILRELRTLARLDHPNIVRYYTGWLEWSEPTSSVGFATSNRGIEPFMNGSDDARFGAVEESESESIPRVVTESETQETEIVFEHSKRSDAETTTARSTATPEIFSEESRLQLRRVGTKSTMTTVSDETVESLNRDVEPSASIMSTSGGAHCTDPSLVLHMQMSLHPMTLTEFLSPSPPNNSSDSNKEVPLTHCYHLEPSITIMLAILEGIEYLHAEGIVHRDLKPGNIFIGPKSSSRLTQGSVDMALCGNCRADNKAKAITLEVRIGDFGLAAVANPDARGSADSEAVGTEMYRPATATQHSTSLDVYALGIIAFELLWRFNTRMERLHCIQQLKQGEFPSGFVEILGSERAGKVTECIQAMISHDDSGVSTQELKRMLSDTSYAFVDNVQ